MQDNSQNVQSIAACLRLLGSLSPQVDESKLTLATTVVKDILAVASPFPPRADDPPLPVLAHYYRTVIEWTVSCTLKLKPPQPTAPQTECDSEQLCRTYLTRTLRLWQLLQLLLEGNLELDGADAAPGGGGRRGPAAALVLSALPAGSVPGSLLTSAAVCLRIALGPGPLGWVRKSMLGGILGPTVVGTVLTGDSAAGKGALETGVQLPLDGQLCRAVGRCIMGLMAARSSSAAAAAGAGAGAGGGDGTLGAMMRPSLEHCVALLTALLDVRPRRGHSRSVGSGLCSVAAGNGGRKQPGSKKAIHAAPTATTATAEVAAVHISNGASPCDDMEPGVAGISGAGVDHNVAVEWARLCVAVLHATHGLVQGHPAPRKVWRAFVPDLVLPLLEISQGQEALGATLQLVLGYHLSAAPATVSAVFSELSRAAQQLLAAVLFHETHVGALAELFFSLMPRGSVSGSGAGSDGGNDGAGGVSKVDAAAADVATDTAAVGVDITEADAKETEPLSTCLSLAADGVNKGEEVVGEGSTRNRPSSSALLALQRSFGDVVGRSYHGQLLQVIAMAISGSGSSSSSDQSRSGGGCSDPEEAANAIMLGLPWLLRFFCRSIARLRRNMAADAAMTTGAPDDGGGSTAAPASGTRWSGGVDGGGAGAGRENDNLLPSHKALAAAEFNCMAVLSYMLLQPPTPPAAAAAAEAAQRRPSKKQKLMAATDTAASTPAAVAEGAPKSGLSEVPYSEVPWRRLALAGLLAAGRAVGAYQPTRDIKGAHCAVLAVLADHLLTPAPSMMPPSMVTADVGKSLKARKRKTVRAVAAAAAAAEGSDPDTAKASVGPYGELRSLSTSLALCAVLDLDHRVLNPHLERVWLLLWSTAATATATARDDTTAAAPPSPSDTITPSSATAAAVLQRTLKAFSELRQLRPLLESLGAAMRVVACGCCRVGDGGADGSVVAALLARPDVLAALRQSIMSAPSGQLPALVDWVAVDLQAWIDAVPAIQQTHGMKTHGAGADLLVAAGGLYDTILASLRLDLTTAMSVSGANTRLLAALSPPLLSSVRQYCKSLYAVNRAATADDDAAGQLEAGNREGAAATLHHHSAQLAMLLRVYSGVVRTNAVCSGLHPEIRPLADQDIAPQHEEGDRGLEKRLETPPAPCMGRHHLHLQGAGYFAPVLVHAATSAAAAKSPHVVAHAGAEVNDAFDTTSELNRLHKALKRAGSSYSHTSLLPALAQLALLPALQPSAVAKEGPSGNVRNAATSGGTAFTLVEMELSRAVHRCLGHRVQLLHERLLRRHHDCPLYDKLPGCSGDGGDGTRNVVAMGEEGDRAGDVAMAENGKDGGGKAAEEEEEVRLLASMVLAPFSPRAAVAARCCGKGDGNSSKSWGNGEMNADGGNGGAAADASYAVAAWSDVLALMGSTGSWAEPAAVAEVLQLALAAAASKRESTAAASPLLNMLQPSSTATLSLLEFQALPGVRQVLPYAWMTAVGHALCGFVPVICQVAATGAEAAEAGAESNHPTSPDAGRHGHRLGKKARKSGLPSKSVDGGAAVATAIKARLDAWLAVAVPKAAAIVGVNGDGMEHDGGRGGSDVKKKNLGKALRRALAKQSESLVSVGTSFTSMEEAVVDTDGGVAAASAAAAAPSALLALLELLHDNLYLQLIPTGKARSELLRRVVALIAAIVDLLLLLRPQCGAQSPITQLHLRRDLLRIALSCLRAWQRLSAAFSSDGGHTCSELLGYYLDLSHSGDDGDGDDGGAESHLYEDPLIMWLVRACRLLVAEAEALDRAAAAAAGSAASPGTSPSPSLLSVGMVYESGRLLTALLAACACAAIPSDDDAQSLRTEKAKAAVAARITFARKLLTQIETSCRTPAATALLCRLSVAAVEAAAEIATKMTAPAGCSTDPAVQEALSRLAARSEKLLSSSSLMGAAAVEAATASAATAVMAGPEAPAALGFIHSLRAALSLIGCHGRLLQLSTATAVATVANPGRGVSIVAGAASGTKKAKAAGMAPKANTAGTAITQMPLDNSSLSAHLLRASRWVAAERRLFGKLAPGPAGGGSCSSSSSSSQRGGSGDCTTAAAVDPLMHCVTLMYGIADWLPVLSRGIIRHGVDDLVAGGSPTSSSDDILALLVAVQQALLECMAPTERFCYSRTSNLWDVLLADLNPEGFAGHSRRVLLECFRATLHRCNRHQVAAVLRSLVHGGLHQNLGLMQPPFSKLVSPLQCMLVSLECLSGPRVTKLLGAQGASVTLTLRELLASMAAHATTAAAAAAANTIEDADSMDWLYGAYSERAEVEVMLCSTLRCLQSVAAREVTFQLAAPDVTGILSAVLSVASCPLLRPQPPNLAPISVTANGAPTAKTSVGGAGDSTGRSHLYFLHAACCNLLAAVVRHHEGAVRHCAALLVSGCRELLLRLVAWASELRLLQLSLLPQLSSSSPSSSSSSSATTVAAAAIDDGLERCAAALARVYEAVSEHPKTLGKYGPHLLADYIIHAATPLPSLALIMHTNDGGCDPWDTADAVVEAEAEAAEGGGGTGSSGSSSNSSMGVGAMLLPRSAHEALRRGAYSLMACLGPPQLQHLHMVLGFGEAAAAAADGKGAARRAALAQLRKDYENVYMYTGKV